jgi:uncharacterized OB-fold protein
MAEDAAGSAAVLFPERMGIGPGGRTYLVGMRCRECGRTLFPPSVLCPACCSEELERVELSARGKVWTYTVVHVSYGSSVADPPYVTAFVELDDGAFVHAHIRECEVGQVHIGMEVELAAADTKEGNLVYVFEPACLPSSGGVRE